MTDILLDSEGGLLIQNGDFVIGESSLQHQDHIIIAQKGEYKEHPEIGVGILTHLYNENPVEALSEIRRNLEYDGAKVNIVKIAENGNYLIDADYH